MATRAPRPPHADSDDNVAATVRGLVEILVGTAAPAPLRRFPRWEDIVSAAARPGTGGRRKRVDVGFELEATRELRERYGDPEEVAHRRSLSATPALRAVADGAARREALRRAAGVVRRRGCRAIHL